MCVWDKKIYARYQCLRQKYVLYLYLQWPSSLSLPIAQQVPLLFPANNKHLILRFLDADFAQAKRDHIRIVPNAVELWTCWLISGSYFQLFSSTIDPKLEATSFLYLSVKVFERIKYSTGTNISATASLLQWDWVHIFFTDSFIAWDIDMPPNMVNITLMFSKR